LRIARLGYKAGVETAAERRRGAVLALLLAALGLGWPCLAWTHGLEPAQAGAMGAAVGAVGAVTHPLERFAPWERRMVAQALAAHGARIDVHPDGKRLGRFIYAPAPVFEAADPFPLWFNLFHATTRPEILAQRLSLASGEPYEAANMAAAARDLRDPLRLSAAELVPIVSEVPDAVDVLVSTRDLWSLRFNTVFQATGSHLDYLYTSLSENNLLGWHKQVALALWLEPGRYSLGPTYADPALLGSPLTLTAHAYATLDQENDRLEGGLFYFHLLQPLRRLDAPWSWGLELELYQGVARTYQGGRQVYFPRDAEADTPRLPWRYDASMLRAGVEVTRAFLVPAATLSQRLFSAGWQLDWRQAEMPAMPTTEGDATAWRDLEEAFREEVLPAPRRDSYPWVAFRQWTPTYEIYWDLDALGISEEIQLGYDVRAMAGMGAPWTGSDLPFFTTSLSVGWRGAWEGRDLFAAQLSGQARLARGEWDEQEVTGLVRYVTAPLGPGRLHSALAGRYVTNARLTTWAAVGGDNGLRGMPSRAILAAGWLRANVEYRSRGLAWLSMRWGGVLFADGAWPFGACWGQCPAVVSSGVGLRLMIPQFNRVVFRCDWGLALLTQARWPGVLSLGFEQAF